MHGGLISLFISMEIKISSFPSKTMCLKKFSQEEPRTFKLLSCTTPQDNFVSQRPQVMSKYATLRPIILFATRKTSERTYAPLQQNDTHLFLVEKFLNWKQFWC